MKAARWARVRLLCAAHEAVAYFNAQRADSASISHAKFNPRWCGSRFSECLAEGRRGRAPVPLRRFEYGLV